MSVVTLQSDSDGHHGTMSKCWSQAAEVFTFS